MTIDESLIDNCKKRNRLAQKELYGKLLPYLNAVCRRYLYDLNALEDVLQETFISIFSQLKNYDRSRAAFSTWAVRICINASLKNNNKARKISSLSLEKEAFDLECLPVAVQQLETKDLLQFLKKMPLPLWEVFNLAIIDDYPHAEIANMLNIEVTLSRKRLSRARKWVEERLGSTYLETAWSKKISS